MRFRRRDKDVSVGGNEESEEHTASGLEDPPSYGTVILEPGPAEEESGTQDPSPSLPEQVVEGFVTDFADVDLPVAVVEPEVLEARSESPNLTVDTPFA